MSGGRSGAGRRRGWRDRGWRRRCRQVAPAAVRAAEGAAAPNRPRLSPPRRRPQRRRVKPPHSRSSSIRSSRCARPTAISARRSFPAALPSRRWRGGSPARPESICPACAAPARTAASSPATSRRAAAFARGPPRWRKVRAPPGQGALCARQLRGSAARRHAQDHRGAAAAGQADDPAFLSDRRHRHRSADRGARRGQCGRAEGPRRQSRIQALAQRFHHSRSGARRCNACRRRMRSGPATAFCASSIPISASRWRSKAA